MSVRAVAASLTVGACVAVAPTAASPLHTFETSLRITRLTGSVVRLGSWEGSTLLGVRLDTRLCFASPGAAMDAYPAEIRISHYRVARGRWWRARTSIDSPPYLVPFGETWHGKSCGPATFEDAIPPVYLDAASLGNPNGCYGIKLALEVRRRRATKQAIIQCGRLRAD